MQRVQVCQPRLPQTRHAPVSQPAQASFLQRQTQCGTCHTLESGVRSNESGAGIIGLRTPDSRLQTVFVARATFLPAVISTLAAVAYLGRIGTIENRKLGIDFQNWFTTKIFAISLPEIAFGISGCSWSLIATYTAHRHGSGRVLVRYRARSPKDWILQRRRSDMRKHCRTRR